MGARALAKRAYRFAEFVLAMLLLAMFVAFLMQIAFRYLFDFPIGWTSEVVNKQKLKAYGLEDSYTNFRSGSGAALDAEISSSIRRGICAIVAGRSAAARQGGRVRGNQPSTQRVNSCVN